MRRVHDDAVRRATCAPTAARVPAVGAGRARASVVLERRRRREQRRACGARDGGWFEPRAAAAGRARATAAHRRRPARARPGLALQPDGAARRRASWSTRAAFAWDDDGWRGRPWHEAVIYELHVGTLHAEGTFAARAARLDDLAELGITAIELMPLADFPGARGWGYDGVLPFAPDASLRHAGRAEALRRRPRTGAA